MGMLLKLTYIRQISHTHAYECIHTQFRTHTNLCDSDLRLCLCYLLYIIFASDSVDIFFYFAIRSTTISLPCILCKWYVSCVLLMLAAADRSGTEPKSHFTRYEKIYFHSIAYTCLLHIRSDSTNIIPFYFRFYLFSFSEQWMRVSIGYGALFATGFHFDVNNRSHDYELENWNSIFFVHSFDWFLFEKRECKRKLTWLLPSTQSNHLISWFLFFNLIA